MQTVATVTSITISKQNQIEKTTKRSMLNARSFFACTLRLLPQTEVLVMGGVQNQKQSKKCEVYSLQTDEWRALPDLNVARGSASACSRANRFLYCIGGYTNEEEGSRLLDCIEMLDLDAS